MEAGDQGGLELSRPARLAVALCWLSLAWGAAIGSHRYVLSGDPGINFIQSVALDRHYLLDNVAAWRGDPGQKHVPLLIEAGFPCLLSAARAIHDRLPFMVNALLLPLLFWMLARYIRHADPRETRGYFAALMGPLGLVALPATAGIAWSLAEPFRDLPSHVVGMFALLLFNEERPDGPSLRRKAFWAGFLCGLGGWVRLSGVLFAVPVALHLLVAPAPVRFRTRLGFLLCLGAGGVLGLAPLVAQNILEGRSLLIPPQGDRLLLRPDGVRGAVRKGWNPLNFFTILPRVWQQIRALWPGWMHLLVLFGAIGWIFSRKSAWRRFVPMVGGALAFALFYACYDKIVVRYLFPVLLFMAAAGALSASWWLDRILRWIANARWRRGLSAGLLAGMSLCLLYSFRASASNWKEMRREWADAMAFKAWLHQALPQPSEVLTSVPAYQHWLSYFAPRQQSPWTNSPLYQGRLRMPRVPLPDDRDLFLLASWSPAAREQVMWSRESLLNRYDLEPAGALAMQSLAAPAFQYGRLVPRPLRREIQIESSRVSNDFLFLFLRELTTTAAVEQVSLISSQWPTPIEVPVQAGVNFIMLPDTHAARPDRLVLEGLVPVPSVIQAQWAAELETVGIVLSDYEAAARYGLLMEGPGIIWRGFPKWYRDYGGLSERLKSAPYAVWTNGTAIRLPVGGEKSPPGLTVRLYFSGMAGKDVNEASLWESRYSYGDDPIYPATILAGQAAGEQWRLVSFIHEFHVGRESVAAGPPPSLRLEAATGGIEAMPFRVLHRVEYMAHRTPPRHERGAPGFRQGPVCLELPAGTRRYRPANPFERPPFEWAGGLLDRFIDQADSDVGKEGTLLAGDWPLQAWRLYGGAARPASADLEAFARAAPSHARPREIPWEAGPVFCAFLDPAEAEVACALKTVCRGDFDTIGQLALSEVVQPPGVWNESADERLVLYQMKGWAQHHTEQDVPRQAQTPVALRVDAGWLWPPEADRQWAKLFLDGDLLDAEVPNGVSYYLLPPCESARVARLSLQSDQPVPASVALQSLPGRDPVFMKFDNGRQPSCALLFEDGDWTDGPDPALYWFDRSVRVRVPVESPGRPEPQLLVFNLAGGQGFNEEDRYAVETWSSRQPLPCWCVGGQESESLVVALRPRGWASADRRVVLRRTCAGDPAPPAAIQALTIFQLPEHEPLSVEMGRHEEAFIGSGFYDVEYSQGRRAYRWTRGKAELRLFRAPGRRGDRLRIVFSDPRDERAAPAALRISLNGRPLEGEVVRAGDTVATWTAVVPSDGWQAGLNRLELACQPWIPGHYRKGGDGRELGIMFFSLSIEPVGDEGSGD